MIVFAITIQMIIRSSHLKCSVRKVFVEILQNSEKPPAPGSVVDLGPVTLLKKRLWHRCFPVNFAKFLRTPF